MTIGHFPAALKSSYSCKSYLHLSCNFVFSLQIQTAVFSNRTGESTINCDVVVTSTWCQADTVCFCSFFSSSSALFLHVLWNWSIASKGEATWSGSLRFFSCSAMRVPSSKITLRRCWPSSQPEIYPCKLFKLALSKSASFTQDPICLSSPKDANFSSWAFVIEVRRNTKRPFAWRCVRCCPDVLLLACLPACRWSMTRRRFQVTFTKAFYVPPGKSKVRTFTCLAAQ